MKRYAGHMTNEQRIEGLRMLSHCGESVLGALNLPEVLIRQDGRIYRVVRTSYGQRVEIGLLWPQDEPETPADTLDIPKASASAPAMTVHEIGAAGEYIAWEHTAYRQGEEETGRHPVPQVWLNRKSSTGSR